jgi:hypothetical protein
MEEEGEPEGEPDAPRSAAACVSYAARAASAKSACSRRGRGGEAPEGTATRQDGVVARR